MSRAKEQFRAALIILKKKNKKKFWQIAEAAGVSERHIQGVVSAKERKGLGARAAEAVAHLFGLTYAEMLEIGEAFLPQALNDEICEWGDVESLDQELKEKVGLSSSSLAFTSVPKAEAKLSAGEGRFVHDESIAGKYKFRSDWLHNTCQPNHAILFDVEGASMEKTIFDGDIVLIDTSQGNLIDNKIYALGSGVDVFVKRLRKTLDGDIEVVSDNKEFGTKTVDPGELRILGRVVWRAGSL